MRGELGLDQHGQHRRTVLPALDAQAAAFEQPQAAAVEQRRHQTRLAVHLGEHAAHLVPREHDRKPGGRLGVHEVLKPGELDAGNVPIEVEQGRDLLSHGVQEGRDVLGAEFDRIAAAMEFVIAAHPAEVRLLSARAEATQAHGFPRALAEKRSLGRARDGSRERPTRLDRTLARHRSGEAGHERLACEHQRHQSLPPPSRSLLRDLREPTWVPQIGGRQPTQLRTNGREPIPGLDSGKTRLSVKMSTWSG